VIDERVGQLAWRLVERHDPERRIVVVEIDEPSLRAVGPWPWPRETVARLLQGLQRAGAGPVMVDMIFADPREGDASLAAAIGGGTTVLAQVFALGEQAPGRIGVLAGATGQACAAPMPRARGFIGNAPGVLAPARPAVGHISPVVDDDGAVRRVPPLVCADGGVYPTLSLAALAAAAAADSGWRLVPGDGWLGPAHRVEHAALPGLAMPADADGSTRVPFRVARDALQSLSAARFVGDAAPPPLDGAMVLVGGTAFGLGDAVPTPQSGLALGMEVHLQLALALLDGEIPYQPRAAAAIRVVEGAAIAVPLLALSLGRRRRAARWVLLAGIGLAGLSWVAHAAWLQGAGWWLGWADLPAFALALSALLAVWGQGRTLAERDRLARQFSAYLPGSVVERLSQTEPTTRIEAQRRSISVLFADIRNFSGFAEGRSPEEVAVFLQGFFDGVADLVDRHGGTVDKFMGDGVMALFGAEGPELPLRRHAAEALAAGCELVAFADAYLVGWNATVASRQALGIGIGIESGPAFVGNFGGAKRRTYTALGHTVTIASRLEPLTRQLDRAILVGGGTAEALGGAAAAGLDDLGAFQLPGMSSAQRVFSPRASPRPGAS
jgi:adenylate cyclase